MGKGKCQLKEKWLKDDTYKSWLQKASSPYNAHCSVCNVDISVTNGVSDALKKHANGKDHCKNLKSKGIVNLMDFLTTTTTNNSPADTATTESSTDVDGASSSSSTGVNGAPSSSSTGVDSASSSCSSGSSTPFSTINNLTDLNNQVVRAEIKYALRVVKNHSSFRSCDDISVFLQDIFHDSTILSKFAFGKTKCMYLIKYGIAPWVRQKLVDLVSTSPFFSVSFDESHNSVLEMEQMDLQIRYWCPETNLAITRYWGSQFQYRTTAEALTEALNKGLPASPTLDQMTQLAMDGPNTNWKVLSLMNEYRENEEMPPMECIGSCGLHVISGSLQTGIKATEWGVDKILMGMYKFLHKAPGRRADYLKLSDNPLFPHRFSPTRWVENAHVAQRAIEIWPVIVKLIKFFLEKPVYKRPQDNKSYGNLVKYHTNPLVKIQLHLFKDVATILNGFLVTFQTDNPMVPFLSMEIADILRRLLRFFMEKDVLKNATTTSKIQKIDVEKKENIVRVSQIKLTTAASAELEKVPSSLHEGLKKGFLKMLQVLIKKVQERSPLKYKLVRDAACLNPITLASLNPEALQTMFDGIVSIMHRNKRITAPDGDKAKEQFDNFVTMEVLTNRAEFKNFDYKVDRLDEFLKKYMINGTKYDQLWKVCIFIFTLSHGQSSVERGFNINSDALKDNMDPSTLESLRIVYDELLAQGNDIKLFKVSQALRLSCKLASGRYKEELRKKKEGSENSEKSRKRKLLSDELLTVKKKKVDEEDVIKKLRKDSDVLVQQAAANGVEAAEMKVLVLKAQSFKESAMGKEVLITELQTTVERIENELKSLK